MHISFRWIHSKILIHFTSWSESSRIHVCIINTVTAGSVLSIYIVWKDCVQKFSNYNTIFFLQLEILFSRFKCKFLIIGVNYRL